MSVTSKLSAVLLIFFSACLSGVQEYTSQSGEQSIIVPEGFTTEVVAGPDLVDYPMFATLDETGRLFVFESTGNVYEKTQDALENPRFRIKLLEDLDGDGFYDKATIFADKVGFPQGGVFYKGSLYASSAPDLLKLTDTDNDGVADQREVLLSGWVLNVNANSLIGPFMGPDGRLYLTNAIEGFDVTTQEGVRLKGETARIWRVKTDGSGLEWISAGGMNNPVELTFTEAGEPIGTETYFTNPRAGQRDALVYWTEGGVYPKPNDNIARDGLVRTGELMPVVSKYSRVSPAGIGRYRSNVFGESFRQNLFSAQFNTHQVIRHKLIRDGASFRTDDEVFFFRDDEDFHPTDVLEDADGSLLVVETGGWFIKGCPLSQVSKPELKGSIYRVRKRNAERPKDPYGNNIAWNTHSTEAAIELLNDDRAFVSDRAAQWLVDKAEVSALVQLLKTASSEVTRTKAVFALYRIGTPAALKAVREALGDRALPVKVAAARSAGLAKDPQAVNALTDLLRQGEPAAKRQAATALGQIGDNEAVDALLAAAGEEDDRFIRHAIIFSLVSLNAPDLVMPALDDPSHQVREAALIALDQMPSSTLRPDRVIPFLESEDAELQRTALWITSLHPEWAEAMSKYLQLRLNGDERSAREKELFGEILISFCGNPLVQKLMATKLRHGSPDQKRFFLNAMGKCGETDFPASWRTELQRILMADGDPQVQSAALEVIRLRSVKDFSTPLILLAANRNKSTMLRLEALSALIESQAALRDDHFTWLCDQLRQEKEAPVRLKAAGILSQAQLSEEQVHRLATDYLPDADAFILSRLVPVFKGEYPSETGIALANILMGSPALDSYTAENLKSVFEKYPADVKPKVDQLLIKLEEAQAERLGRIQAFEKSIEKGDLENGRRLFFGKAVCWTCHTIGPEGGTLGPDLTSIQRDRSAHDLIEAIVYPGLSFVREYETYRIKTRTGDYTGIIQEQSPDEIVLGTAPETAVRIPRNEISAMEILNTSVMPQGLDKLLTDQEMADLMAFILGQDQDPETDARLLR